MKKRNLAFMVILLAVICVFALMGSPAIAAEESTTQAETAQPSPSAHPQGMMGGGMMGKHSGGMMMHHGMIGGHPCMGMMGMGMMRGMDRKTLGQMMQIRGRMMKDMGELLEKRGKELEQGK